MNRCEPSLFNRLAYRVQSLSSYDMDMCTFNLDSNWSARRVIGVPVYIVMTVIGMLYSSAQNAANSVLLFIFLVGMDPCNGVGCTWCFTPTLFHACQESVHNIPSKSCRTYSATMLLRKGDKRHAMMSFVANTHMPNIAYRQGTGRSRHHELVEI